MATIFDVYIANALAALGMTDLIPIGEDPGGTEADGAINAEDFIEQILTTTQSYKIASSIVSDDLVIELTHLDDSDPSAAKPLWLKVDDEWVKFTAAISLTIADGTNWANLGSSELATQDVDLFAYMVIETGASAGNKLSWARTSHGHTVSDFSSTQIDENYLAGPTNYNATDKVVLLGRFNATLGVTGTFLWTIPATSIIVNHPIYDARWLVWVPTYDASDSMTFLTVTTSYAVYKVGYRSISFAVVLSAGTTGGVASNTLRGTLPFTALNTSYPVTGFTNDGAGAGGSVAGFAFLNTSLNYVGVRKYDISDYGLGTGRTFGASGNYEI